MKKTILMALVMLFGVIVSAAQPKFTEKELAYLPATAQIALFKAGIITPSDVLEAQTMLKQSRDELTDSRVEYRLNLVTYKQLTKE